jgi:hypothetical protein
VDVTVTSDEGEGRAVVLSSVDVGLVTSTTRDVQCFVILCIMERKTDAPSLPSSYPESKNTSEMDPDLDLWGDRGLFIVDICPIKRS